MTAVLSPQMPGGTQFNVLSYGAIGDGSTENATAFNACFTAAGTYAASNGGAVVVIPPGRYKISSPVTQKPNCTYYAYGAYVFNGGTYDTANWHMFNIGAGTGYTGDSHITWLGGVFDAKGQNCPVDTTSAKNIFLIGQGYNYRFEDVTCRNVPNWHAIDSGAINGLIVNRCRFEGWVDKSTGQVNGQKEAIQVQEGTDETKAKNISVTNCYLGPAIDGSGLSAHPILVGSHTMPTGTTFENLIISGNLIESAQYAGIRFYGAHNAVITDNVISVGSGTTWGIQLTVSFNHPATSRRVIVKGNSISGFGNTGIYVKAQDTNDASAQEYNSCIISDNVLAPASATGSGITLWYLKDSIISNNVIDGTTGTGIFVDDLCDRCKITGNKIANVSANGIQIDNADDCLVSDNHIYNVNNNGIFVANNSTGTMVSNNYIKGAGRTATGAPWAGVRISNTGNNNTTISGNRFRKFGSTPEAANPIIIDGTNPTGTVILNNDFGTEWSSDYLSNITTNNAAFSDNAKYRTFYITGTPPTITNNATPQNILTFWADANSVYELEGFLVLKSDGTAGNARTAWGGITVTGNRLSMGPAVQTTAGYVSRQDTNGTYWAGSWTTNIGFKIGATGVDHVIVERGIMTTGGTAGNFSFQCAQNAATPGETLTIDTGTYLKVRKLDV